MIEIKTITVMHPEVGQLTKVVKITKDENGNEISREAYAPENHPLIQQVMQMTEDELIILKNLIK